MFFAILLETLIRDKSNSAKTAKIFDFSMSYARGMSQSEINLTSNKTLKEWKKTIPNFEVSIPDNSYFKKETFLFSNQTSKSIVIHSVNNEVLRNEMIVNIQKHLNDSSFIKRLAEMKGRKKWKYWFYYKIEYKGEILFANIGLNSKGKYILNAISDYIPNKRKNLKRANP